MSISFDLPMLEDELRAGYGDLDIAAKEALLIDAYRTGRLSIGRMAEALGRSVSATLAWLDEHRVGPSYTLDGFAEDQRYFQNHSGSR